MNEVTRLGFLERCHSAAEHSRAVLTHIHEEFLMFPQSQRQAGTVNHQSVLDHVIFFDPAQTSINRHHSASDFIAEIGGLWLKTQKLLLYLLASLRSCSAHSLSDFCCTSSRMFMVRWKWPQERLTLTAVSCLSPVKTHTLIPANRRASIVSWTLSCSLENGLISLYCGRSTYNPENEVQPKV